MPSPQTHLATSSEFSPGTGGGGITELTGDVTAGPGSGSQFAAISPGAIDNTMISGAAGIEFAKLEPMADATILVGSAALVGAPVAMSGDVSITNTGATTVIGIQGHTVDATPPNAGEILISNGGQYVPRAMNQDVTINSNGAAIVEGIKGILVSGAVPNDGDILIYSAGGNEWAPITISGAISLGSNGATSISAGVIDNTMIAGGAAIEFAKLEPLLNGNILVGDGVNTAVGVPMSGDATIDATGAVTVTGASSSFVAQSSIEVAGGVVTPLSTGVAWFYPTGSPLPQALNGPGAADVTIYQTRFTSTGGGDAISLADGTFVGQVKKISYVAEAAGADTGVITPTTPGGFATVTLNSVGDYVVFTWGGGAWTILEYIGATVA